MGLLKLWTSRAVLALIVVLLTVALAYSFPVDLAFLMAIDLMTWVEAAVAVYIVTSATRIRPMLAMLRTWFYGSRQRSRRRIRARFGARKRTPSNDDEPALALSA